MFCLMSDEASSSSLIGSSSASNASSSSPFSLPTFMLLSSFSFWLHQNIIILVIIQVTWLLQIFIFILEDLELRLYNHKSIHLLKNKNDNFSDILIRYHKLDLWNYVGEEGAVPVNLGSPWLGAQLSHNPGMHHPWGTDHGGCQGTDGICDLIPYRCNTWQRRNSFLNLSLDCKWRKYAQLIHTENERKN